MILAFEQPVANDNEAPCIWSCLKCDNAAFVLFHDVGVTTIRCAQCNEDVTHYIIPTLPTEIGPICQP